jgi:cytochrome P450
VSAATATAPVESAESTAPLSPAGPVEDDVQIRMPPARGGSRFRQSFQFVFAPMRANLEAQRRFGDAWQMSLPSRKEPFVVTTHPDHVKSLFKAKPHDAPSLTGESPLRPILGPNSVLTSVGERHMRQRKLLLPLFHGAAVQRYVEMIVEVAEREIYSWPVNKPFALAPRMQAITLDVIMGGVFGIGTAPSGGTVERRMRDTIRRMLLASTNPAYQHTPVAMSIVALHHREDVYPEPHAFRPERFLEHKPGTYTWIPFGGGIRRCLGAALAMAEQKVVLRTIVQRTDLAAPNPAPEQPRPRNVTMIPNRGGRVVVSRKLAA